MTPHEKAVTAINTRLERLQANLREAKAEALQRFLFQSLVVTLAVAEALNDYIRQVGEYAQRRHAQVKQATEALGAQHAALLKSGQELLEQLKANPNDRAIRKEIEATQQKMAAVQKSLRRDTNALQRELAPSLALIDEMAITVRRFSEADHNDALKRVVKAAVSQTKELFASHPALPSSGVIDAVTWEASAVTEIERAVDFYEAYARAGSQATLALELMILALTENPPDNAEAAAQRSNDALAQRLKEITVRFTGSGS